MDLTALSEAFLAILQGLSGIFPVSSSAHLAVYSYVLGLPISFERILLFHLGSVFAIAIYYHKDILDLFSSARRRSHLQGYFAAFAATSVVGYLLRVFLTDQVVANATDIAILWIVNGLVLIVFGAVGRQGPRTFQELHKTDFLIIGMAQGLAALPGISRLGLTLGASLWRGLSWPESVRFTFLLSIPTVVAAVLFTGVSSILPRIGDGSMLSSIDPLSWLFLFGLTLGSSLLGLYWLYRYLFLGRRLLAFFGLYCLVTGVFFMQILPML